jgi:hypothetical protein
MVMSKLQRGRAKQAFAKGWQNYRMIMGLIILHQRYQYYYRSMEVPLPNSNDQTLVPGQTPALLTPRRLKRSRIEEI